MRMQTLVSAGFTAAVLVGASVPALAWTSPYPDVDFDWYLAVGSAAPAGVEIVPAPRAGYIWVSGRYEGGTREVWVPGHFIKDDYQQQILVYNSPYTTGPTYATATTTYSTGPMILRDRQGNIIPTNPSAYPIDQR